MIQNPCQISDKALCDNSSRYSDGDRRELHDRWGRVHRSVSEKDIVKI